MNGINDLLEGYVQWFFNFADPWYCVLLGLAIVFLLLVGTGPIQSTEKGGFGEAVLVYIRKFTLSVILTIAILWPTTVWVAALGWTGSFNPYTESILPFLLGLVLDYWTIFAAAVLLPITLQMGVKRYLSPWLSRLERQLRIRQSGESLSDIRIEQGRFEPKHFVPSQYYQDQKIFLGMDENHKPVMVDEDSWKKNHQKIIGPTQLGKGVLIGVQMDQAIRKGMTVVFFDPKPDRHAAMIMAKACQETGRTFLSLDLNETGKGYWAPFAGGNPRDRRARILYFCSLNETGRESDFYSQRERQAIDEVFPGWNGQARSLKALLDVDRYKDCNSRAVAALNELLMINTFSPRSGRGLSIERCLENNAVVYVKGSTTDEVVIKAGAVFIQEMVQETMRLHTEGKRSHHLYFVVDELKFMMSKTLSNALATIASFDAHLTVAYQSLLDLKTINDPTIDPRAAEEAVNINCKDTVAYMAGNFETAEWAAEKSGTTQKMVPRFEDTETNPQGGEIWGKKRMLNKVEEPLVTANQMMMLGERVGVWFHPGKLAQFLYTCWVPVQPLSEADQSLGERPISTDQQPPHPKVKEQSKKTPRTKKPKSGPQKGNTKKEQQEKKEEPLPNVVTLDNIEERINRNRERAETEER